MDLIEAIASCANRRSHSCGRSIVEVEHAPEALATHNTAAVGDVVVLGSDELVPERLVISLCVIVRDVISDDLTQVTLPQGDDARQALAPYGTNEALGVGVQFGLRAGKRTLLTPPAASIARK